MWILAFVLNIVLLVLTFLLVSEQGLPSENRFLVFVIILIACPVVNILALFLRHGWLRLYCRRRALEEKKKIEALSGN